MSRLSILTGIVLALNPLGAVWAQQRDGFQFTSPLSLSAGYDNNFLVGSQTLDDTVVLLTSPTLSWTRNTHKTNFTVDYQPEFEIFSQHSDLNAWNHAATLRFSHRVDARLTFDAGDSFISTMDPSRQLQNSLLLLPRGLFRQNVLYAGAGYRLDGRTTLNFRVDNAITTVALPGAEAGLLDQNSIAGTVSLDRTLNRHHSLSASYSYLYILPFHSGAPLSGRSANQSLNNFDLSYVYTVNPTLIFRASGGGVRSSQFAYTATGAVEKRVGGVWLTGGYQRYLGFFGPLASIGAGPRTGIPFAQGLLPSSIYQVVSFGLKGKLTRRLGAELSMLKAREPGFRGGNISSWIGRCRLDYKLHGPLVVFTQLDFYNQNLNEFSQLPLSRQRYFGGVEIVLSRPREIIDVPNRSVDSSPDADQPQTDQPGIGQRDN